MRASSKCLRVESFVVAPPPPSFTSDTSVEAFIDLVVAVAAAVLPPSISANSNIRCMLETVMTIQVAHG